MKEQLSAREMIVLRTIHELEMGAGVQQISPVPVALLHALVECRGVLATINEVLAIVKGLEGKWLLTRQYPHSHLDVRYPLGNGCCIWIKHTLHQQPPATIKGREFPPIWKVEQIVLVAQEVDGKPHPTERTLVRCNTCYDHSPTLTYITLTPAAMDVMQASHTGGQDATSPPSPPVKTISDREAARLYAQYMNTVANPSWIGKLPPEKLRREPDGHTTEAAVEQLVLAMVPAAVKRESKRPRPGFPRNCRKVCPQCGDPVYRLMPLPVRCDPNRTPVCRKCWGKHVTP